MVRMGKWRIDLPHYFVARYFDDFVKWARMIPTGNFPATYLVMFNEGDLADSAPDPEQGKTMLGAWLLAKVSRRGVECEAYAERDRRLIALHCEKMQAAGIRSRDRLREPERPGLPIPRLQ